jgi:SAM-dependent methyltransferase
MAEDRDGTQLAWTGERFVPGQGGAVIAYEHVHRYAAAAQLVRDRDVVDLACGEGYGVAQLGRVAKSVIGIDIDPVAVEHAQHAYGVGDRRFVVGDMCRSGLAGRCADVVVCFEALEHVADGVRVVAEAHRLLRPGGLFIVSTPDKDAYNMRRDEPNPFHAHEYSIDEFSALLLQYFDWVQLAAQMSTAGSVIWPADASSAPAMVLALQGAGAGEWGPARYEYAIAVCGTGPVPSAPSLRPSVMIDPAAGFLSEHDELWRAWQGLKARSRSENATLRELLVESEARVRSLQDELAKAMGEIGALREADAPATDPPWGDP